MPDSVHGSSLRRQAGAEERLVAGAGSAVGPETRSVSWEEIRSRHVAVGPPVARRPPHGSVQAEFPHTALTADDWQPNTQVQIVWRPRSNPNTNSQKPGAVSGARGG